MAALEAIDEDIAEREEKLAYAQRATASTPHYTLPSTSATNFAHSWSAATVSKPSAPSKSALSSNGPHKTTAIWPSLQPVQPTATSSSNSYSNSSNVKASTSQKRPAEGSINAAPPAKRLNTGVPNKCVMCGMSYHVPAQCERMNWDLPRMRILITQLAKSNDPQSSAAVNALLTRYNAKMRVLPSAQK